MMTDSNIQQAIDACRPASEDLRLPEMDSLAAAVRNDPEVRRQYERSQGWDASLGDAFRDVPVPAGLADRLLAAVGAGHELPTSGQVELSSPRASSDRDLRESAGPSRRWPRGIRRRTWIVLSAGVATAALVGFLLVGWYFGAAEPVAGDRLAGEILEWNVTVQKQGWNDNVQAAELRERPLDRAVRGVPRRWCQIRTVYDSRTMVYDLTPPGGAFAVVFCMHSKAGASSLPNVPFSATGGLTLGVWRRGDMVYVLAVQGGPRRYREFIEAPPVIGFRSGIGRPASLTEKV